LAVGEFAVALRTVKEGLVELELPDDPRLDLKKGPQRAGGGAVFYNPAARTSRDLTVVALRALPAPPKGWRVLDGLCGSGVRGLRVLKEVEHVAEVVLNDGDPAAAALAAQQAARVGDARVKVTNRPLEEALADSSARFDFIDIDPYGSPARYLTAAAGRAARPGFVAVTATDVAALCGVWPGACLRRYGAAPMRNEWMKETAARILLGAAARKAGAVDRAVEPVATLSTEHFIRLIYRVVKGKLAADKAAAHLGFLKPDPEGKLSPRVVPLHSLMDDASSLAGTGPAAGPLWTGPLHDAEVLARAALPEWIPASEPLRRFLAAAVGESSLPPYFFSLDQAGRKLKASPPTTAAAVEELQRRGFKAARTHFDTKGVKTDASPAEFLDAFAALAHRR